MKRLLKFFAFCIATVLTFSTCDLLNNEVTDPEKTMGKVGNYWSGGANGYGDGRITISENNDGNVVATLSFEGSNYEIEGKITDNAIYDYVYSNGDTKKPFTLIKFDAKVGDKWEYKVGSNKVVREVVRKSTDDDTEYGFWLVKTIDVEETIPTGTMIKGEESDVKKILWKFNHKFGFIAASVTKIDGTIVNVQGYSTNAAD